VKCMWWCNIYTIFRWAPSKLSDQFSPQKKQALWVLKLCCVVKNSPDQPHYHMSDNVQVKSSTAWWIRLDFIWWKCLKSCGWDFCWDCPCC
jgi:hypothetical protein